MSEEIAVRIDGLYKQYRLGQIGGGTLTADLQSWWARVRKKEDPNTKIGQSPRLSGKTLMALNGIDLTVRRGEALGIIGSNGAGKSTMLKILSRITAPSGGTVDIYGRIASMLEVGTGFSPEMTGRENIYMNGAILGMTRAEIDAKMEDIIEFSEIRAFIDTPVKRYSSGMYVKLAFSVAAHLDAEIMIMDEVLAVGDMAFQKKCLDKMRDAAQTEGRTVLYVSHNMNTIRTLCERCIVLDQGKIIFDGDTEEAIGVYMKNAGNPDEVEFDLSDRTSRRKDPATVPAKMLSLRLQSDTSAVFAAGKPLRFDLRIRARREIAGLHLRMRLCYGDETPIGTVPDTLLGGMAAGEERTFRLEFDAGCLTRGMYQADLALFEQNEFGTSFDVDTVTQAFRFTLTEDPAASPWNERSWGHVRFPELRALQFTEH